MPLARRTCIRQARPNHVALELGKDPHHVQEESVRRRGAQFRRGANQQFDSRLPECVEDCNAIAKTACQAVEAIYGNDVDVTVADMFQESLKGWAIRVGAGLTDIIKAPANPLPGGVGLGLNEVPTNTKLGFAG